MGCDDTQPTASNDSLLTSVISICDGVIASCRTEAPRGLCACYSRLKALLAGLFPGASMINGLLLGLTVFKVSAFAFRSTLSAAEQQRLKGDVTFLNQIHLIFLDGWYFFVGLGWIFMGLAASGGGHWNRAIGFVAVTAGAMVLGGVMAAFWRPTYGEMVPLLVQSLQNRSVEGGLALGLAATGLLTWSLSWEVGDESHAP